MGATIRPYSPSDALRSDRSAGDRLRHRRKIRQAIRENISDIISEESIIGQDKDRVIKVPIRGIKEYRFVYGDNTPGVGTGDGDSQKGQVIGQAGQDQADGGQSGDQPGMDYYETDITLEELVEIMFEDLELPDLESKKLREVMSERTSRRKGYRRVGIHVHMDKKRTARSRVKRKLATKRLQTVEGGEKERFPFHDDDLRYKRLREESQPQSNAVVICIMDTSGSMGTLKKYLARSFFFLLYQFVRTRYENVEVVFVAHHTKGREVTEEEFFHKGESGGTFISSGYNKALEIINERYHPDMWNVYAFHCSDGDNFDSDNDAAMKAALELSAICNLFGYGEIKTEDGFGFESSMLEKFKKIETDNFHTLLIESKEDIWPCFKAFLTKERATTESRQD
ncbi:MAG: sporulation protein YhbH [Gammaproteobacteria bacterium]